MVCRICGTCKLKEEFYTDRWHRTGRKTACIQCLLAYQNSKYTRKTPKREPMKKKRKYTKIMYERHLNDHPLKKHPYFKLWDSRRTGRSTGWGAWLREKHRPIFDEMYEIHITPL